MQSSFQYPFAFAFREELQFETFVAGKANAELMAFLQSFATHPQSFVYLWGGPGSGKTHLLQALCHAHAEAIYLPLQQLSVHDASCLDGLEHYDFLVFDDIEAIAGHRDWEEKLFFMFNQQQARGGSLCMAASMSPQRLPMQLADLKSRLQLALVYELKALNEEETLLLLQRRALQRGMELKPEVASYLMSRSGRSMQDLLALLDRLDTLSLAEKRRLTIPFVKEMFGW